MIDQLAPELLYLTFYFQGEPYLNPDFLEMVKYATSKKIYTATSTNAHYLNDENARKTVESGLDRLIQPQEPGRGVPFRMRHGGRRRDPGKMSVG